MAARGSPPPAEGPTIIVLATDGEGNAPYWRGNDAQSLEAAFTTIISDSISCDIQMDKPFDDETKACNDPESDVRLNGNPLSCPAEWEPSPDADDFIRLKGSACTELNSGQAEFPCGSIVVE